MAVTPKAGTNSVVVTGGTPVQAVPANPNGGFITNPLTAADQGLGTAETLYVDPVSTTPGSTPGSGNGTATALAPGQTWYLIPGQTTPTFVNAASSGHKFTVVWF